MEVAAAKAAAAGSTIMIAVFRLLYDTGKVDEYGVKRKKESL